MWSNYALIVPAWLAFHRRWHLHGVSVLAVAVASVAYHKHAEAAFLTVDVVCALALTAICSRNMFQHQKRLPMTSIYVASCIGYAAYFAGWLYPSSYEALHTVWHLMIAAGQTLVVTPNEAGGWRRILTGGLALDAGRRLL